MVNKLKSIKSFRKSLGLTQQQLADFLGIERGSLAMIESGRRTLPTKALIKLAQLNQRLELPKNKKPLSSPLSNELQEKQREKTIKTLEDHAANCLRRATIFKRKLAKLREDFKKGQLQLHSSKQEINDDQEESKIWFELIEVMALQKLEKSSEGPQIFLEFKIAALQAEAKLAIKTASKLK